MPTDKEPLTLTLTEWELSDLRDLLEQLKERRAVPQTLTLNKLSLRLVRIGAEQLRQHAAEGQIALAAAMLGTSTSAPPSEQAEQGTAFMSRSKPPVPTAQPDPSSPKPPAEGDRPVKRGVGRPRKAQPKAKISVSVDLDVLNWLADQADGGSLSTVVNAHLRARMENR